MAGALGAVLDEDDALAVLVVLGGSVLFTMACAAAYYSGPAGWLLTACCFGPFLAITGIVLAVVAVCRAQDRKREEAEIVASFHSCNDHRYF